MGAGKLIARDTAEGLRQRYAAATLTEVYMKTVGAERLGAAEEAEALCEDIALIAGGRIVARSTPEGLKRQYDAASLEDVYLKAVHQPVGAA